MQILGEQIYFLKKLRMAGAIQASVTAQLPATELSYQDISSTQRQKYGGYLSPTLCKEKGQICFLEVGVAKIQ